MIGFNLNVVIYLKKYAMKFNAVFYDVDSSYLFMMELTDAGSRYALNVGTGVLSKGWNVVPGWRVVEHGESFEAKLEADNFKTVSNEGFLSRKCSQIVVALAMGDPNTPKYILSCISPEKRSRYKFACNYLGGWYLAIDGEEKQLRAIMRSAMRPETTGT